MLVKGMPTLCLTVHCDPATREGASPDIRSEHLRIVFEGAGVQLCLQALNAIQVVSFCLHMPLFYARTG